MAAKRGVTEADAVEMIDVGGPSMLRGAAKNFAHVAPVCRPERYGFVLDELRANGGLSLETRRELAAEAFATTAAYEAAIATWFAEQESFPETVMLALEKVLDLSYGENPHQRAAYYAERGARTHLLSRVEQLHGKALSFNNLNDLSAARMLVREFALPACVIVKHANPCGVAIGATIEEAYDEGTRIATRSPRTAASSSSTASRRRARRALAEQFVEVLFAPGYSDDALDALRQKQNTRILIDRERRRRRRPPPLQARARRTARPGRATARSRTARAGRSRRRARRAAVGRPRLRLARLQARFARTRSSSSRTCRRSGSAPGR